MLLHNDGLINLKAYISGNRIKVFSLILLINVSTIFSQYQNYRFENFTSDNGLSHNSVVSIYQDSKGFLWLGTYGGLNRFDGYNFKVYKPIANDPSSISGSLITSIVEDKKGNLWIASLSTGLNRYNRSLDNFTQFKNRAGDSKSLLDDRIRTLLVDRSGRLWVGTESGLCRYDFEKKIFVNYSYIIDELKYPRSKFITSICEDSDNNLWITTWSCLIKFNPKTNKTFYYAHDAKNPNSLSGPYIHKVYVDKQSNVWVSTGQGLNKYNPQSDNFLRLSDPNAKDENDKLVQDILEDSRGNLWIATNSFGLEKLDRATNKFTNYRSNVYDRESLSTNILICLYEDSSGILWIGSDGGGLIKFNFLNTQFSHFKNDPLNPNSLSYNKTYSLLEDRDGLIWVGTFNGGLNSFDPNKKDFRFKKFYNIPQNSNSLIDNKIRTLCEDKVGNIWIGTESGISIYNKKQNRFKRINKFSGHGLNKNNIFALYCSKTGEILAGTYGGGLNIYNPTTEKFTNIKHDPNNPNGLYSNIVISVLEDKSGIIWLGTEDCGLERFDRATNKVYHYKYDPAKTNSIKNNHVLSIYEDSRSNLWVGTTEGLEKVIRKSSTDTSLIFKNYSTKNGLPDNCIQSIIEDNDGNIWAGTTRGIFKLNPTTEAIENFGMHDGLQSNEFYVNAVCKRKSTGELLFGGDKGFNIFQPGSIKKDLRPPKIVLTEFSLFNIPVPISKPVGGKIILHNSITETKELTLSYTNNFISFDFAALNFADPEKNSYAVMMEGLEENWRNIGNRHYANYSNVPPGEYIFRVKASNKNGIWNEDGIALKIIIVPPFWQTIWFKAFAIFLVLTIAYTGFRIKVHNYEKRRRELEKLIHEKTELNEQLIKENEERQQAEYDYKKAKEKAEHSEKLKTEFLAQMSHEIRSPISTIFNFTSLIKEELDENTTNDKKEYFSAIEQAGERIVRTIDLILNLSELQSGSYECNYEELDINEDVLDRIYSELAFKASKKNLEFILKKHPGKLIVFGDEYSVIQIFVNLIENAIKYTDKGFVEVSSIINEAGNVVIKVADSGIGMSEEYLADLFTPFTQEEQGYTRRYEGNGLGLALVKKYCEMNNAQIFVESVKGKGTMFTVIFNHVK